MSALQDKFIATNGGGSQEDRILRCLADRAGRWVAMPRLARVSGSYVVHSRVAGLNGKRRKAGLPLIENLVRHRRHGLPNLSFYRLPLPNSEFQIPNSELQSPSVKPANVEGNLRSPQELTTAQNHGGASNRSTAPACGSPAQSFSGELFPELAARPGREMFA